MNLKVNSRRGLYIRNTRRWLKTKRKSQKMNGVGPRTHEDGFAPRTRSNPDSVAARAEEVSWKFPVGTTVQALHYTAGSTSEKNWRIGTVTSVNNISENQPVYTVCFNQTGKCVRMGHSDLDLLSHARPPERPLSPQAPQHTVLLKIDESLRPHYDDEARSWNKRFPFNAEEQYGDNAEMGWGPNGFVEGESLEEFESGKSLEDLLMRAQMGSV
jgi:hypothetical protein